MVGQKISKNFLVLLKMEVIKESLKAADKAISFLKNGGVVICPTDTVYGFLADATDKKAVEKIYKIKKRPKSKPLPVFVKDFKMANNLAKINNEQAKILNKFWPGKYTFVLKRKSGDLELLNLTFSIFLFSITA